ncbi:MAG: hypothetical protein OXE52_08140 [Chloroflexi bacterium]|nr:hypothetical protein [Chloroflexota bacterium]
MGENDVQKEFDAWFKKLKPLPKDHYGRTVQIAKELADGVPRGFWGQNVERTGSPGDPVYERKRRFWSERISNKNRSGTNQESDFQAMRASLVTASYVEETRGRLELTPIAFSLLRKPTRIERIDRWQTAIEIALLLIFLAHFLVLLSPAVESTQRLFNLS